MCGLVFMYVNVREREIERDREKERERNWQYNSLCMFIPFYEQLSNQAATFVS